MTSENLQSFDMTKDYLYFRKVLFSGIDGIRHIPSGSFFEMPLMYFLSNPTDTDVMFCDMTLCANYEDVHVPERCAKDALTIDTTGCHVGFVKLKIGEEYFRKPRDCTDAHDKIPNYLDLKRFRDPFLRYLLEKISTRWQSIYLFSSDKVYAVSCPQWPTLAHEWITRKRLNGLPTENIVQAIVNGGCYLVSKPHGSNPNDDTQWRYSFSQAETILINKCWTDVQKYIYHLLRIIKRDVAIKSGRENNTFISNYYIKTLMLWACEEKPSEFWKDRNIVTSVRGLLLDLIEKLIERKLPHYFIPAINLMDDLPCDTDVENEICLLLSYRESDILGVIRKEPKAYQMDSGFITVSNDIIHSLVTKHTNIDWTNNTCGQLFHKFLECFNASSNNFFPELAHLHKGIMVHLQLLKLNKYGIGHHRQEVIATAEELFDLSIQKLDCGFTRIRFNLGWSIFDMAQKLLFLGRNEHLSNEYPRLYSRSLAPMTISTSCYVRCTDAHFRHRCSFSSKGKETNTILILQRLFNEIALPVNATYFICSAFRANFYFNALCDYRKVLDICNEVDQLLNSFGMLVDGLIADVLPFPLRNEWSCLYDKYIQIVLGFLTLHRTLTVSVRNRRRMVHVHICPIVYLTYIYTQCRRIFNEPVSPEGYGLDYDPFRRYEIDMLKHTKSFSRAILRISLYISRPKLV